MWLLQFYIFFVFCALAQATNFIKEIPRLTYDYKNLNDTKSLCYQQYEALDSITFFKMFDASTKFPEGLAMLNFYNLGNWEECYTLTADTANLGKIYGKYCLAKLNINLNIQGEINKLRKMPFPQLRSGMDFMAFRVAICIPSGCKAEEIQPLFGGILEFSETYCSSEDSEPELDPKAITTIVILAIFVCIVAASTIFDLILFYTEKEVPHQMLIAFSALTNGRKLITATSNAEQLLCLNGIKAISMMWVLLCHVYMNSSGGPIANFYDINLFLMNTENMFISSGTLSVDTFFAVGGLVTVYAFMRASDKGVKFNIIMYYIHRYIRLTPALAIMILIHATLVKYLGSGPLWKTIVPTFEVPCQDYWWSGLLYIQNYAHELQTCVPQSWYLSVDFQLFLLSPLVLLPLKHFPKIGLWLLGILIALGVIIPFSIGYALEIPGFIMSPDITKFMWKYYKQTYPRFGPYVIGMLAGYLIYQWKKNQSSIRFDQNKAYLWACLIWVVSLGGLLACTFATHDASFNAYEIWSNSAILGFLRNAWAVGICGIILVCVTGFGGPVNWFLSLPIFQFLCKLSYAMYLTHYVLVSMRYAQSTVPVHLSHGYMMWAFWGDFMWTLLWSIILCLMFESPMITLEKFIFGAGVKTKSATKSPPA